MVIYCKRSDVSYNRLVCFVVPRMLKSIGIKDFPYLLNFLYQFLSVGNNFNLADVTSHQ
jgi:hypothetical protein